MTKYEVASYHPPHHGKPVRGRVERGVHLPSLPSLAEIAAALGVPLAALVQPVDRMPVPGIPCKSDTASLYTY